VTRVRVDERNDRVIARFGDAVLFEYVFRPALAHSLAPRPYFHPVRTLAGTLLTDHKPADHAWHLGLAYSWPVVNSWNVWGGPTFVRDRGYTDLDNHGEIRHTSWSGEIEELEWLDGEGEMMAGERRVIGVPDVDEKTQAWTLDLESEIQNTGRRPLRFGSPTTEGRPMAGYAGLAWRGTEALRHASVVFEGGAAEGDPMGRRSRWLAVVAKDGGATVAMADHPDNPGVPNRWFVRTDEYVLVTSSPVFDTDLVLEPGRSLRLRHRMLIADGVWSADRLDGALRPFAVAPR
jgi:hypothetical protein